MTRWRWFAALVAAVIAAAVAYVTLLDPQVGAARVVRKDVVQSVVASGRIAAPFRVDIGSQIVGTVTEVPVAEGQAVRAGQTLCVIEAMKVFNTVHAEHDAIVDAVLVASGIEVDAGQPLLRFR